MPRIPLYSHQSQPNASPNVRANPSMFASEGAALDRLGSAIARTGDMLGDVSFKLQQAQNYKITANMDTAMESAWSSFQQGLNPNSDETKWEADWQKTLDATVSKNKPSVAGPLLQQQLEMRTKQFRTRTSGDVSQQAKAASVQKATDAGMVRNTAFWKNGDEVGAEQNLNEMADLGLISREKIPTMMQKGREEMQSEQVYRMMQLAPSKALESLKEQTPTGRWKNFSDLSEQQRGRLAYEATGALRRAQADAINGVQERSFSGEMISDEELQVGVEQDYWTAAWAKGFAKQQQKNFAGDGPTDAQTQTYYEVISDINKFDPDDKGLEVEVKLQQRILHLPDGFRQQAQQRLNDQKSPDSQGKTEAYKTAMTMIDENFDRGIYGRTKMEVIEKGPDGKKAIVTKTDPMGLARAQKKRAEKQTAIVKYLQENPKATVSEAAEQVLKNSRADRAENAWAPLINPLTGKAN